MKELQSQSGFMNYRTAAKGWEKGPALVGTVRRPPRPPPASAEPAPHLVHPIFLTTRGGFTL